MYARVTRSSDDANGAITAVASRCFAKHGARTAVVCSGRTLTFSELDAVRRRIARSLQEKVPPRARIGIFLKNGPEYLAAYFGSLAARCIPFLLDANFNCSELATIRDDCGVSALLTDETTETSLRSIYGSRSETLDAGLRLTWHDAESTPRFELRDDTEICRFTSGSTGQPKCIEFSGAAVNAAARNWVEGTEMLSDDRTLCLAALSNGLAFNTSLLASVIAGGQLHLHAGLPLTRPIAKHIEAAGITRLVAFPTFYRLMVEKDAPDPALLAGLRCAISAGAPLWPKVRAAFHERFALDISDYYGIAEAGPCTFEHQPHPGAGLGRPLPGVSLKMTSGDDSQTGELKVRTASMASRYLNCPGLLESRLDEDGYYATGDRGYLRDGRLHLTGRTQDFINIGGRKVDPTEICRIVERIDGVTEAVVLDETDAHHENLLHLVVVAHAALTPQSLLGACRRQLAAYKVPQKVSFVTGLPKNGIGKLRTSELRRQLHENEVNRAANPIEIDLTGETP